MWDLDGEERESRQGKVQERPRVCLGYMEMAESSMPRAPRELEVKQSLGTALGSPLNAIVILVPFMSWEDPFNIFMQSHDTIRCVIYILLGTFEGDV